MWNYHHTLKLFENRTIMLELLSIQPSQNGCLPLILKLLFASHLILWLTQLAKGQNLDFPVPSLLSINYHSLKIEHLHIKLKWFGFELNYAQVKNVDPDFSFNFPKGTVRLPYLRFLQFKNGNKMYY